jgi:hypothetical protein
MTTAFPHTLGTAADPARAFRGTPWGDEALLSLALAAIDARDVAQPMLLVVSFSSYDYIAHLYGPDSWEAWDELSRLDAALGRFFAALDQRVGADGWAALLSADHGGSTLPEAAALARPWCKPGQPADRWQRGCGPLGRILPDELASELRTVADHALGAGDWIDGIADPYVYLAPAARALPAARRALLDDALTSALRAHAGVAGVWSARRPPSHCRRADTVDDRVCRALVPGAPGELYIALQPGWFFDPDYVPGFGASHGSPYLYDRAVPLLVRAPGRVPASKIVDTPIGPDAYARTAAHLLDITPPPYAKNGRDLTIR